MAKRKKRKESSKDTSYLVELKGMLLILIAIIGICKFGIVGAFIQHFSAFFVGAAYNILLAVVFLTGLCMIVKREYPNFFAPRLIGIYSIVIVAKSGRPVLGHTEVNSGKAIRIK